MAGNGSAPSPDARRPGEEETVTETIGRLVQDIGQLLEDRVGS